MRRPAAPRCFSGFQFSFIWLSQSCSGHRLRCSSVRECHRGYADEVTCVTLFSSQLVPWSGRRAGDRGQDDACSLAAITSSWTVRHYKAVRMTSEPYADNVPLSFVSLHYGPFVSLPPFFCLLTLRLHALFTCPCSPTPLHLHTHTHAHLSRLSLDWRKPNVSLIPASIKRLMLREKHLLCGHITSHPNNCNNSAFD